MSRHLSFQSWLDEIAKPLNMGAAEFEYYTWQAWSAGQASLAWRKCSEMMPDAGTMIVKRWANGEVWAGVWTGSPKAGSFDEWRPL